MANPRGFHCNFRDTTCNDGRCKIGYCAPEHDLEREYGKPRASAESYADPELLKEAKSFAREVLKYRGIKPTPDLIAKLIKLPKVQEEAQRRVDWVRNSN